MGNSRAERTGCFLVVGWARLALNALLISVRRKRKPRNEEVKRRIDL